MECRAGARDKNKSMVAGQALASIFLILGAKRTRMRQMFAGVDESLRFEDAFADGEKDVAKSKRSTREMGRWGPHSVFILFGHKRC
jgi:hypothetical protein